MELVIALHEHPSVERFVVVVEFAGVVVRPGAQHLEPPQPLPQERDRGPLVADALEPQGRGAEVVVNIRVGLVERPKPILEGAILTQGQSGLFQAAPPRAPDLAGAISTPGCHPSVR